MDRQNFIHDFQQKLIELFRASPAADLERNLKALMGQTFSRLDLVTREEFEVQRAVLLRTREKLEELQRTVAELEAQLAQSPTLPHH